MMHSRSCRVLFALLALAAQPIAAQAAPLRVAVVMDELVDDKARDRATVEAAIIEFLSSDSSLVFVDAEQANRVRRAAAGKQLMEVDVAGLVTSVDADILVLGQVRLSKLPADDLGLVAFEASGAAKVVFVDSSQVMTVARADAMGRAFGRNQAIAQATGAVSKGLAKKILGALPKDRAKRLELLVDLTHRLDASSVGSVLRCVQGIEGVSNARTLHFGKKLLKIELSTAKATSDLAESFAGEDACGLFVYGYSKRSIKAGYRSPNRIPLTVARFTGRLGKRDKWLRSELASQLRTELEQCDFIDTESDRKLQSPKAALARRPGRLALVGEASRKGKRVFVSARVVATHRSKTLVSKKVECPDQGLSTCVAEMGQKMAAALYEAVQKHSRAIPMSTRVSAQRAGELEIADIRVEGVYPARVGRYDKAPIGTVRVRNRGSSRIENIVLRAELVGFTANQIDSRIEQLAAGEEATIPVRMVLDREQLKKHDTNRSAALRLVVTYRIGDFTFEAKRTSATMVFDRNALSWIEDSRAVAAFVTARDPIIQALASEARAALPADLEAHPLAMPIALHQVLKGLRYAPDPMNPFDADKLDYVLYPRETLARGEGDCDDLAVLYAALLQAAGLPAMMIQTPGHVFVGVGTDVPAHLRERISVDPTAVLRRAGRTWVPIETTQLRESFLEGWRMGAAEIGAVRDAKVQLADKDLIIVKDAWRDYPSANLARHDAKPKTINIGDRAIRSEVDKVTRAHAKALEAMQRQAKRLENSRKLNTMGVRQARAGQLEQAEETFKKSLTKAETVSAVNNLGNVYLIRDANERAFELYQRALALEEPRIETVLNALLASHQLAQSEALPERKDFFEQRRAEYVAQAHQLDADELTRFMTALVARSETRASKPAKESWAALAAVVEKQVGKPIAQPSLRAGVSPGTGNVAEHVRWLE